MKTRLYIANVARDVHRRQFTNILLRACLGITSEIAGSGKNLSHTRFVRWGRRVQQRKAVVSVDRTLLSCCTYVFSVPHFPEDKSPKETTGVVGPGMAGEVAGCSPPSPDFFFVSRYSDGYVVSCVGGLCATKKWGGDSKSQVVLQNPTKFRRNLLDADGELMPWCWSPGHWDGPPRLYGRKGTTNCIVEFGGEEWTETRPTAGP